MKRFFYFILIAISLVSCTTTRYGMKRATLDDVMDDIKSEYYVKGYYLTSELTGQDISTQITNTRDARNSIYEADNANAKVDEYAFQDSLGNTLKFAIAYNEALQENTMYLLDVNVIGREVSNLKDYESLCGKNSPIAQIKQIPQDQKVVVGDAAKTQKGVLWGCLGVGIVSVLISILVISGI